MKRFIKLISLIMAVVLCALSLGSCAYLDDLRAHRGVYSDDTKRTIILEDNNYKLLKPGSLSFVFTDTYFDGQFYITKPDLPVLLTHFEGDPCDLNKEKTVLCLWTDISEWYIREDLYDDYKEALDSSKLDHYFLSYTEYPDSYYDIDYDVPYMLNDSDIKHHDVLLDDDLTAVINKTLAIPADEKIKYTELSNDSSQKVITVAPCDRNMYVTNPEAEIWLIKESDNKYYIWNGNAYDEKSICPVAGDDADIIAKLFSDHKKAVLSDYNIYYEFENNYYDYGYSGYADSGKQPAVAESDDINL